MTYAVIQMLMEKLKQLINGNDNPLINNPEIAREQPQLQLLYEELGSIIQPLFIDQHQEEKVEDLKKRFTDAAEEAQYVVDLFLSGVHIRNNGYFPTSEDLIASLNLDAVRKSFESVKVEFQTSNRIQMDSSCQITKKMQDLPASFTRDSPGLRKSVDYFVVGLDADAEMIRDRLVEGKKKVEVVSIVGMGGIGKTTLVTKLFNDRFIMLHFHVRVWATVSQTYDKRAVLVQVLESIRGQLGLEKATDSRLREMVHKGLMGRRYLIVIDDIWDVEAWDDLKLFFPHDNSGSRILLTSRLTEVAMHASSDGLIHHMGYLNKERSWELLCQKVFHGNKCPEWSIKPGMQIVENCNGLPLSVVVIAGVLAKEAWNKEFWLEIAERSSMYFAGDHLETFALSYNHLPRHLKECLLYLGGFPADYTFQVQRLIWLWVAEGFILEAGNQSLEDIAEGYLLDLIGRCLINVAGKKNSNGGFKAFKLHNLVRELCVKKGREEQFILKIERPFTYQFSTVTTAPCKPVRVFTHEDINILDSAHLSTQNVRSVFWFSYSTFLSDDIAKYFRSFLLLRVLDLHDCRLHDFPYGMKLLVHLRYLAIWNSSAGFPPSICNLWRLQTLICISYDRMALPSNISNLVNLRHLWSYLPSTSEAVGTRSFKAPFFLSCIEKPMKLQTASNVELGDGVENFQKCFPCIKELICTTYLDEQNDFKSLTCLEKLKLTGLRRMTRSTTHDCKGEPSCRKNPITFPSTLKTLTLLLCRLPWSDMSILQSLPNLEVLKLRQNAFEGSCWKTVGQEFPQLKFLKLDRLNIKQWESYSSSFPCLRQLKIFNCDDLEEIPLEIGEIPTLELIKIKGCRDSVGESVRRIQEEQHDMGNYDLKIEVARFVDISI